MKLPDVPHMPVARGGRQFGLLTYILIALVLYILYTLMSARPKPPRGGDMFKLGGPVPVLQDSGGFAAVLPISPDEESQSQIEELESKDSLTPEKRQQLREDRLAHMDRLVHLDLKGAAPKLSYMEQVFPLFHDLGATGLLVEWEDMFPYEGELSTLASGDCYTKEEVKKICQLAKQNSLYIIPLIQTFGHMEFVLKGAEFKHLREHPQQPTVINPHKEESKQLIQKMIDQQMALQPDIDYLHIGADEVWALGTSDESKDQMDRFGVTKDVIFLNYIREIAGYIKNNYAAVEIMMWDDMFRGANVKDIERSRVNKLVTPVIWKYTPDTDKKLGASMFQKYTKLFRNVWIATAFKGATGSDQFLTNISYHYENHMAWLRILTKPYTSVLNIKGTIITGWQRYDHFATLCELLPVGIPSLAVCLNVLQHAAVSKDNLRTINHLLGCVASNPIQWTLNTKDEPGPKCSFPGHEILEGAYEVKNAKFYADFSQSKNAISGWQKEYNLKRQFSQSFRISFLKEKCKLGLERINTAESIMAEYLAAYFKEETITEWMETYVYSMKKYLSSTKDQAEEALKQDTWPRRPIHKINT